jgi:hypothetical protein
MVDGVGTILILIAIEPFLVQIDFTGRKRKCAVSLPGAGIQSKLLLEVSVAPIVVILIAKAKAQNNAIHRQEAAFRVHSEKIPHRRHTGATKCYRRHLPIWINDEFTLPFFGKEPYR